MGTVELTIIKIIRVGEGSYSNQNENGLPKQQHNTQCSYFLQKEGKQVRWSHRGGGKGTLGQFNLIGKGLRDEGRYQLVKEKKKELRQTIYSRIKEEEGGIWHWG